MRKSKKKISKWDGLHAAKANQGLEVKILDFCCYQQYIAYQFIDSASVAGVWALM